VKEEDYTLAKKCADERKACIESMPPRHQYLQAQVQQLKTGVLFDRMQAIRAIVGVGDSIVIPDLSTCLDDKELRDLVQEAMWTLFHHHNDPIISDAMVEGVALMNNPVTVHQAVEVFTGMIKKAPDFAEGYNKRATALYSMKKYHESIADCKTALSLQPWHFGAASGMGICHLMLGDEEAAADSFELALALNPSLGLPAPMMTQLKKRALQRKLAQADSPPGSDSAGGEADRLNSA